jgi:hypothetical protein
MYFHMSWQQTICICCHDDFTKIMVGSMVTWLCTTCDLLFCFYGGHLKSMYLCRQLHIVYVSSCISTCPCIYVSNYLYVYVSTMCLCGCLLAICLSVYLSVSLSAIHFFIRPSAFIESVSLFTHRDMGNTFTHCRRGMH